MPDVLAFATRDADAPDMDAKGQTDFGLALRRVLAGVGAFALVLAVVFALTTDEAAAILRALVLGVGSVGLALLEWRTRKLALVGHLLLGLVAGALSLVPIFGTIISSIPIILIALVSGEGGDPAFTKALAMFLWIAGIHLLEANLLNPKILGESAHMHPVVVIFALLAGESVFGLTGALLAVPVASMVQTIFLYVRGQRDAGWGAVVGESLHGEPLIASSDGGPPPSRPPVA